MRDEAAQAVFYKVYQEHNPFQLERKHIIIY